MYAVIADVHSNIGALESVLRDIEQRGIRDLLFAGDAVGYGHAPGQCIALLRNTCRVLIAGNHDRAACGLADTRFFNEHAKAAIDWTRQILSEEMAGILTSLPLRSESGEITLVHATPQDPEQWQYLLTLPDAERNFLFFPTRLCFIGHSHRPVIIEKLSTGDLTVHRRETVMRAESRYIINAGSVGQPRDGDPRASYALVDGARIEIVRVAYDVEVTQREMVRAGLPLPLSERLAFGM